MLVKLNSDNYVNPEEIKHIFIKHCFPLRDNRTMHWSDSYEKAVQRLKKFEEENDEYINKIWNWNIDSYMPIFHLKNDKVIEGEYFKTQQEVVKFIESIIFSKYCDELIIELEERDKTINKFLKNKMNKIEKRR